MNIAKVKAALQALIQTHGDRCAIPSACQSVTDGLAALRELEAQNSAAACQQASEPKLEVTEKCRFCKGTGTAISVDAVKISGGKIVEQVNPRKTDCICCGGTGQQAKVSEAATGEVEPNAASPGQDQRIRTLTEDECIAVGVTVGMVKGWQSEIADLKAKLAKTEAALAESRSYCDRKVDEIRVLRSANDQLAIAQAKYATAEAGLKAKLALQESQRTASIGAERKDCEKALLALAGWYPTPQESYGTNSSWAISDLCRAILELRAKLAAAEQEVKEREGQVLFYQQRAQRAEGERQDLVAALDRAGAEIAALLAERDELRKELESARRLMEPFGKWGDFLAGRCDSTVLGTPDYDAVAQWLADHPETEQKENK